eukprot:Nitzschia sp. Nitz4//scaffold157_size52427//4041//8789//NITZ4_006836-RA/size52427-processed-gene-0.74-mRNA-1//-1//CDS//3329537443//2463//frame0
MAHPLTSTTPQRITLIHNYTTPQQVVQDFDVMFPRLKAFYLKNGHSNVTSGHGHQELSSWAQALRRIQPKYLKQDQRQALGALGFNWSLPSHLGEQVVGILENTSQSTSIPKPVATRTFRSNYRLSREMRRHEVMLPRLRAFYEKNGHPFVPHNHEDKNLYRYFTQIRQRFRTDVLRGVINRVLQQTVQNSTIFQLLTDMGVWDDGRQHQRWFQMFRRLESYAKEHNSTQVSSAIDKDLYLWTRSLRVQYRRLTPDPDALRHTLAADKVEALERIGFEWESPEIARRRSWSTMFPLLKQFYEEHGHTDIPPNHTGGLYRWTQDLRIRHSRQFRHSSTAGKSQVRLSADKMKQLRAIGFSLPNATRTSKPRRTHPNLFPRLEQFYLKHGHTWITEDCGDPELYAYYRNLRNNYKWQADGRSDPTGKRPKLQDEMIEKLSSLGVFDRKSVFPEWAKMIERLQDYIVQHGTTVVDVSIDAELHHWTSSLRTKHRRQALNLTKTGSSPPRLAKSRLDELNQLGFDWDPPQIPRRRCWAEMIPLVQSFYHEHGHACVSAGDPAGLHKWIKGQLSRHGPDLRNTKEPPSSKISPEKIKQLRELGLGTQRAQAFYSWGGRRHQMLERIRAFHAKYGHTFVPEHFEDQELYIYVKNLRENYKWQADGRNPTGKRPRLAAFWFERLNELGIWDESPEPYKWPQSYPRWPQAVEKLQSYVKVHGTTLVNRSLDENLYQWTKRLRTRYRRQAKNITSTIVRTLPQEKMEELARIGFDWEGRDFSKRRLWSEMLPRLQVFQKLHGHTWVPEGYPNDPMLGRSWPTKTDTTTLGNQLGMAPDEIDSLLGRLCDFHEEHGNTFVFRDCGDLELYEFVRSLRKQYKWQARHPMEPPPRIGKHYQMGESLLQVLKVLGIWDTRPRYSNWSEMFTRLVGYKTEHNTTIVDRYLDEDLYLWARRLRLRYYRQVLNMTTVEPAGFVHVLSQSKLQALHSIDFQWETPEVMRLCSWHRMFPRLQAFYKDYGHYNVPVDYPGGLYNWTHDLIQQYNQQGKNEPGIMMLHEQVKQLHDLQLDRIRKPPSKKGVSTKTGVMQRLEAYFQTHGNTHVPDDYDDLELVAYLDHLRKNFKWQVQGLDDPTGKGPRLNEDELMLLKNIGVWSVPDWKSQTFSSSVQRLSDYISKYGDANVDPDLDIDLHRWTRELRRRYQYQALNISGYSTGHQLSEEQLSILSDIGFDWGDPVMVERDIWRKLYPRLEAFKRRYGHVDVPSNFTDQELHNWTAGLVERYGYSLANFSGPAFSPMGVSTLAWEKIRQLQDLGMQGVFPPIVDIYTFWKERRHTTITQRDQIAFNACETHLREEFAKFQCDPSSSRIPVNIGRELEEMKYPFLSKREMVWERRFQQLCAYKEKNGHTEVPRFGAARKATPGLWEWCAFQRGKYGRLDHENPSEEARERIAKLNSIGFKWRLLNDWNSNFERLKAYQAQHGHLKFARDDPSTSSLASWYKSQKTRWFEIPEERRNLLLTIPGFSTPKPRRRRVSRELMLEFLEKTGGDQLRIPPPTANTNMTEYALMLYWREEARLAELEFDEENGEFFPY